MKKKNIKKKLNFTLWWNELFLIKSLNIKYKYSYLDNILYLNVINLFQFFFFNKKNIYNLYFYIMDIVYINKKNYISYQSFFFDQKLLIYSHTQKNIKSLSSIYSCSVWLEREFKELNGININKLKDTRKLLYNYNYNINLNYNNYNSIIQDLNL